jgi:hypothetical protein
MQLGNPITITISNAINGDIIRDKISGKINSKIVKTIAFMIKDSLDGVICNNLKI